MEAIFAPTVDMSAFSTISLRIELGLARRMRVLELSNNDFRNILAQSCKANGSVLAEACRFPFGVQQHP